jgi:glycosyltransferase involved in cell wall biosynthesis
LETVHTVSAEMPAGGGNGRSSTARDIDVLMITYNRPEYTRVALARLLETCDASMRVWLWHNGEDGATLEVVKSLADHPRVYEFYHSRENARLREPTNWLWRNAKGAYLAKVDDDCRMPEGWGETLRQAHEDVPQFGIISCWPFLEEDFLPEVSRPKIGTFNGHRLLQNFWVGGSGYLMKRQVLEQLKGLGVDESFSKFCLRAARHGWINGWYYPFLYMDHMDDPRSPYTTMRTEEDFRRRPTLSSLRFNTTSLQALRERAHMAAVEVQQASINPRDYFGWYARMRRIKNRLLGRGRVARFNP